MNDDTKDVYKEMKSQFKEMNSKSTKELKKNFLESNRGKSWSKEKNLAFKKVLSIRGESVPLDPSLLEDLIENSQKNYNIYSHPNKVPVAVKQGFSWPGFFFGGFWALLKGLWVHAIILYKKGVKKGVKSLLSSCSLELYLKIMARLLRIEYPYKKGQIFA